MEQPKRHELRQRAHSKSMSVGYTGISTSSRTQEAALQRRSNSPAMGMPADPTNPAKAVLQGNSHSGLQIGNGANRPVNTGHYNTALSNLHSGAQMLGS